MQKKSLCADDLVKETIEQYSSFVYRLAYSLVKSRSDADDIHQEVFIAFMKKSLILQVWRMRGRGLSG